MIATVPTLARELVPWSENRRPGLALDDLSQKRVELDTSLGRTVILHFFATWCEPCRPEMAALRRIAEKFAQKPLTILAISVAEPDDRVRRFFDSEPVNFPILLDRDRSAAKAWRVSTLPTTFILDRSLKPRLMAEGDVEWDRTDIDRQLSALVAENFSRPQQPDRND